MSRSSFTTIRLAAYPASIAAMAARGARSVAERCGATRECVTRGKFIDKDGGLRQGNPMLLVAAPTVVIRGHPWSSVVIRGHP